MNWLVQVHLAAAAVAVVAGAAQFILPKGGGRHRLLGWVWVLAMAVVAVGSFGITGMNNGWPGPIHALSVFALVSLTTAVLAARRGRISAHRKGMIGLYSGLTVAGLFTLLPGRLLGNAVWGWFMGG